MRKLIHTFLIAILSLTVMFSQALAHTEMDKWRLALTLAYEIGGAKYDQSVEMVASSIINRHKTFQKRNASLTITDVLYQSGQYATGPGGHTTGPVTQNYSAAQLNAAGLKQMSNNQAKWNRCVQIAEKALNGSLGDKVNGAYSYHKGGLFTNRGDASEIGRAKDNNSMYGGATKVNHSFYVYKKDTMLALPKHKDYNMDPGKGAPSTGGAAYSNTGGTGATSMDGSESGSSGSSSSSGSSGSTSNRSDSDGARESGACTMDAMQNMYLKDGNVDKFCWYCKVVVVLTNAYLQAANQALPVSISLGKLCAKLGFMIWLAYYILLQVSSISPITPFKMMQEILVMGFKVALAYYGASLGMTMVVFYFINPIVGLGVDYGSALLDELMTSHGIDAALAGIQTPH